MSYNGSFILDPKHMAKSEIKTRTLNIIENLWWKFVPGKIIEVRWPHGWTTPEEAAGGGFIQVESSDPNDHYRPWLEAHVGKQGWDWNWRIGRIYNSNNTETLYDTLYIKIRKSKEELATVAKIKWM